MFFKSSTPISFMEFIKIAAQHSIDLHGSSVIIQLDFWNTHLMNQVLRFNTLSKYLLILFPWSLPPSNNRFDSFMKLPSRVQRDLSTSEFPSIFKIILAISWAVSLMQKLPKPSLDAPLLIKTWTDCLQSSAQFLSLLLKPSTLWELKLNESLNPLIIASFYWLAYSTDFAYHYK